MIVPCFMAMPRSLRWLFTVSKTKSCEAVDQLSEFVLLKQVSEGQDRGLIGYTVADQVDPGETTHGWYLNQRLFHAWIAEASSARKDDAFPVRQLFTRGLDGEEQCVATARPSKLT